MDFLGRVSTFRFWREECICSVGKSFCNLDSDALETIAAKYPSIPSCVQNWPPLDWFICEGADFNVSEVNLPLSYLLFLPFSLSNLWHGFLLKLDKVPAFFFSVSAHKWVNFVRTCLGRPWNQKKKLFCMMKMKTTLRTIKIRCIRSQCTANRKRSQNFS